MDRPDGWPVLRTVRPERANTRADIPASDRVDPTLLSRAVVAWVGRADDAWPHRDDSRLVTIYGRELGIRLIEQVHVLADDFDSSDADLIERDLGPMGDRAAAEFRDRHPEIDDAAVEALAWAYTFDRK